MFELSTMPPSFWPLRTGLIHNPQRKSPARGGAKVSGWHPCRAGDLSTLSRASSLVYGRSPACDEPLK
jgi:hypothetical protein